MRTTPKSRDAAALASRIAREIAELAHPATPEIRSLRKAHSTALRDADGAFVVAVARHLYRDRSHRWVALELIRYHGAALASVTTEHLEEFGRGLDSWDSVDAFAGYLAGAAWLRGQIPDRVFDRWARSEDRWLRRAALVSTVVLNSPSHGGKGDVGRTLRVCEPLVGDRDDMVVKALSWALRKLVAHDESAVRGFLSQHESELAARVKREVGNKLATGLKNPRRPRGGS